MARRSQQSDPEVLRKRLVKLLTEFEKELNDDDLRAKVRSLVPAHYLLRDLGGSLIPKESASSGVDRVLLYLRKYPLTVIPGEELMVVSGIGEWARRVRQLRRECGWAILTGVTMKEMQREGELSLTGLDVGHMKTDDYLLADEEPDRDAAFRWHVANRIRKSKGSVQARILEYLRLNAGKTVTGEELRYLSNDKTEWARRVRELRTEEGWPIATKNTGRPDLPIGGYVLEQDRQGPAHDRLIPDPVRRQVLVRDNHQCCQCGWTHSLWNPSDPRHLELHHVEHHAQGGDNTEDNLLTVCNVCHDDVHRREGPGTRKPKRA